MRKKQEKLKVGEIKIAALFKKKTKNGLTKTLSQVWARKSEEVYEIFFLDHARKIWTICQKLTRKVTCQSKTEKKKKKNFFAAGWVKKKFNINKKFDIEYRIEMNYN